MNITRIEPRWKTASSRPVYGLLGGKIRDCVPGRANGWFADANGPEEFAAKDVAARDASFRGIKWDPFGDAYLMIEPARRRVALGCVEAVAAAVGHDVALLIEAHGRFSVPTAVGLGRDLERIDIYWFEEPVPPDNLDALAEVKRRVRVPVAAGERLYSELKYKPFVEEACGLHAEFPFLGDDGDRHPVARGDQR